MKISLLGIFGFSCLGMAILAFIFYRQGDHAYFTTSITMILLGSGIGIIETRLKRIEDRLNQLKPEN